MQNLTFQESIDTSHELIEKLEQKALSDEDASAQIVALLSDMPTARGFFVSLLTGDWNFGNRIPTIVIETIKANPGHSHTLLARNLVMSCATAVVHRRSEQPGLADGSDRVAVRSAYLITKLNSPDMLKELLDIKAACEERLEHGSSQEKNTGTYHAFLERWSYDSEQIHAAHDCVKKVIEKLNG